MAKKKAAKKKVKKLKEGKHYKCPECGIVVSVVDECGCDGSCDLECCGEPMTPC